MAYNEFTLDGMIRLFGLQVVSQPDAFVLAVSVTLSSLLRETLAESVPLALEVSTEKARSEFIIAPVLAEVRRQLGGQISLFSGIDFIVDTEARLRGVCDFLFSLSPLQCSVQTLVVAVVEAKNENNQPVFVCTGIRIAYDRTNQNSPCWCGRVGAAARPYLRGAA